MAVRPSSKYRISESSSTERLPCRNTPLISNRRSRCPAEATTTTVATVATAVTVASDLTRRVRRVRNHRIPTPIIMSSAAPVTTVRRIPNHGMLASPAAAVPTMAPRVFTPYTAPMDRSPAPATSNVRVISGRVMPAQNVAGNMMSNATPYRARLNPVYPPSVRAKVPRRSAVHPNDAA